MIGAYLATNLISSAATITVSSEDSNYPKANLYDRQAANVFRSQSLVGVTIEIDFGAAVTGDTIAIMNHNLTDAATLSLKADSVYPPVAVVATPSYRLNDLWKAFISTSARYWELTIIDNNSSNLEIGQLVLGVRTAFPRGRRIGDGYIPGSERSNISSETYAGVFWNYHLFTRKEFNPSFRVGSAAELAVLSALDAATYGNLYPFVYVPDGSGVDCYYVRKERSFEPTEINRIASLELVHDYQIKLTEESRGLEVTA
jgi:hypothetical protein